MTPREFKIQFKRMRVILSLMTVSFALFLIVAIMRFKEELNWVNGLQVFSFMTLMFVSAGFIFWTKQLDKGMKYLIRDLNSNIPDELLRYSLLNEVLNNEITIDEYKKEDKGDPLESSLHTDIDRTNEIFDKMKEEDFILKLKKNGLVPYPKTEEEITKWKNYIAKVYNETCEKGRLVEENNELMKNYREYYVDKGIPLMPDLEGPEIIDVLRKADHSYYQMYSSNSIGCVITESTLGTIKFLMSSITTGTDYLIRYDVNDQYYYLNKKDDLYPEKSILIEKSFLEEMIESSKIISSPPFTKDDLLDNIILVYLSNGSRTNLKLSLMSRGVYNIIKKGIQK